MPGMTWHRDKNPPFQSRTPICRQLSAFPRTRPAVPNAFCLSASTLACHPRSKMPFTISAALPVCLTSVLIYTSPPKPLYLWMNRPKSELSPQNTPFLWTKAPFPPGWPSSVGSECLFWSHPWWIVPYFLSNCPLQASGACSCKSPGKPLICNHLIISIIAKSHLPGEAKSVSPGKP